MGLTDRRRIDDWVSARHVRFGGIHKIAEKIVNGSGGLHKYCQLHLIIDMIRFPFPFTFEPYEKPTPNG